MQPDEEASYLNSLKNMVFVRFSHSGYKGRIFGMRNASDEVTFSTTSYPVPQLFSTFATYIRLLIGRELDRLQKS